MKIGKQNGREENGRYEKGQNGGAHGVAGRSGRPSDEFRAAMRMCVEDPKVKRAFMAILRNAQHPQFASLWAKATAYAYGAPAQTVEHTGGIELNVREYRETFESRVNRVVERLRTAGVPAERN